MYDYLPREHEGRAIRLQEILELPPAPKTLKHRANRATASLWRLILTKMGDGQWYSIVPTLGKSKKLLKRLADALKNRAHYKGYDKTMLNIIATYRDGICFHWTRDPKVTFADRAKENREKRLKQRKEKWKKEEEDEPTGRETDGTTGEGPGRTEGDAPTAPAGHSEADPGENNSPLTPPVL